MNSSLWFNLLKTDAGQSCCQLASQSAPMFTRSIKNLSLIRVTYSDLVARICMQRRHSTPSFGFASLPGPGARKNNGPCGGGLKRVRVRQQQSPRQPRFSIAISGFRLKVPRNLHSSTRSRVNNANQRKNAMHRLFLSFSVFVGVWMFLPRTPVDGHMLRLARVLSLIFLYAELALLFLHSSLRF